MKILVIGLGSMGKRRIRCLQALDAGTIIGFDPRTDRRAEATEKYGIAVWESLELAMAEAPDVIVISTPPDLHMTYAQIAIAHNKHFFYEASVPDGRREIARHELEGRAIVAAPSCTMRFHPALCLVKKMVDAGAIGRIEAFTTHAGEWLPDWHPWEDYRTFYASRRETGACREIVTFELTWLTWLVGPFDRVAGMRAKLGDLDCDIDDIYQILLRAKSGALGHLMVDVLARTPVRALRLIGRDGTIEWNAETREIRVYRAAERRWTTTPEPKPIVEAGYTHLSPEGMYVDEMRAFLDAVHGNRQYPYTMEEEQRMLEGVVAAEHSDDHGKFVPLG